MLAAGIASPPSVSPRREALLESKEAGNQEILATLDEVWARYRDPRDLRSVTLHAMPRMGSPDARTVAEANLRLLTEPADILSLTPEAQRFWNELGKFREDVEKAFLEAFTLRQVDTETRRNLREEVNVAAVLFLGWTNGPRVSRDIRRNLEKKIFRASTTGGWSSTARHSKRSPA